MRRRSSGIDRLDANDRKKIRRILIQMISIYISAIVIVIAGVAARSALTAWPDVSPFSKVDLR